MPMRLSVTLKRGGSTINMEKKVSRGNNKEVILLDMAISAMKISSISSSEEEEGEVEDSNTSTFSTVAPNTSNSRRRSYLIIQM
jgi:hypothetical protein